MKEQMNALQQQVTELQEAVDNDDPVRVAQMACRASHTLLRLTAAAVEAQDKEYRGKVNA